MRACSSRLDAGLQQALGLGQRAPVGAADAHGQRLGPRESLCGATTSSTMPSVRASCDETSSQVANSRSAIPRRHERGEARGGAPRRREAELVVDEAQLRALDGDAPVAGQGEVDAAADDMPVQQRDGGHRRARRAGRARRRRGRRSPSPVSPWSAFRSAPDEKMRVPAPVIGDQPHRLVGGHRLGGVGEPLERLERERVLAAAAERDQRPGRRARTTRRSSARPRRRRAPRAAPPSSSAGSPRGRRRGRGRAARTGVARRSRGEPIAAVRATRRDAPMTSG